MVSNEREVKITNMKKRIVLKVVSAGAALIGFITGLIDAQLAEQEMIQETAKVVMENLQNNI